MSEEKKTDESKPEAPKLDAKPADAAPGESPAAPPAPAPAKALMALSMAEKFADGTIRRWMIEKGETIPEAALADAGFEEGKHYQRGEPPKPGPVTIDGKDYRKAKTAIIGIKDGERFEFAPGSLVPVDQLGGLKEGEHFE